MIIGITGKANAGKDTIADYLVKNYGYKRISLAEPIKRLVKDVFALDDYTVYDREAREKELEKWPGWSVRKLLQFIGTELFRKNIDDAIWVKSLLYKIKKSENEFGYNDYTCSDIRFPNELSYLKNHTEPGEFFCIKVVRPGKNGDVGIKGHESEAYDLQGDFEIINDGNFEYLYNKVEKIIGEINENRNGR